MNTFLTVVGIILFLGFGIAQIYAGYIGVDYHLGGFWAIATIISAFMFRFMLPMIIGSFFGAYSVWGWHWAFALLFAVPGLIFMFPAVIAMLKVQLKR